VEPRFTILGHTRFRVEGQFTEAWGPTKLRGILAVLLLHPGQSISFETMIDWVWPDDQAPANDSTFHTYGNRIRSALNRMAEPPALTARDRAYRLDVSRQDIDYFVLRHTVDQADVMSAAGEHAPVIPLLSNALHMWTGRPLADAKGERANNFREAAENSHLVHAHETLLRSLSALGRHDEVLRRWADLPLHLQSNLTLVKRRLEALHGSGLHSERITFHLQTRKRLQTDFNHEEAAELTRFHEELASTKAEPVATTAVRPPPAEPTRAPLLLPHDTTDFAGRAELLGRLDNSLISPKDEPPTGIMLLVGAPGIGKTALVVHWAHRVRDRFPGGVLYADLNGFSGGTPTEPGDVVNVFLAAFGYPVERIPHATGRAAKLRSLLTERRTLVVLDNAASADAVLPLLDSLGNSFVLITSRRGLSRVTRRGAPAVRVPPMTHREAVAWLTRQLAQRATREPDSVAELATICDGSPLALRSVADHVSTRPGVRLTEFAEELRVTPNLLRLGDDGAGSESSIRTIFSWSYRALAPEEQRMFRLLSIHPGPDLSLEAAAALGGREIEKARELLDKLVHANLLLQPHSRNRYQYHDLLRRYARECASTARPDERAASEIRLLEFFVNTALNADRKVFPYRQDEPATLVDGVTPLDFDSDEQAMGWCVRELTNLMALTHNANREGWYEYAIRLPMAAGEILQRLGFHDDVLSGLDVAIKAARSLGDLAGEAIAVGNLGYVLLALHDFTAAESHIRAAGELHQRAGDVVGSAMALHYLGRLRVEEGRITEGVDLNRMALTKLRGQGMAGLEVVVLHWLGQAHRRSRDFGSATTFCRDGLWLAEKLEDERGQAVLHTELGAIAMESGDAVLAKGYCARALPVHERLRDPDQAAKTYSVLAAVHQAQGNLPEAERCARRATASYRQSRNPAGELAAHDALGQTLQAKGQPAEAAEAWAAALTIAEDLGDPLAPLLRRRLVRTPVIEFDAPTTPLGSPNRVTPPA
jgi:tetratricopeptide (TPR) repeat protein/DNA-binding SARP family transcriptional activator